MLSAVPVLLADSGDLFYARQQMALSLGWHIVLACLGIGFPVLVLIAEWRSIRTGDELYRTLARRWARAVGVLFAIGAVSGTILSFELGILWPRFMGRWGDVIGLPFAIEGIAFFIEAIFIGIYLYGWDRFPPRLHLLTGIPIAVAGVASAFFVIAANSWMNNPQGFRLVGGRPTDIDPWGAMFNASLLPEATHMILAAFIVAGFGVASVYACAMLKGRRDRYHRSAFLIAFTFAAVFVPIQIVVGDWAARHIATTQPVKLAAIEGLDKTQRGAPLSIGGIYIDGELHGAISIPNGLSLLAFHDPDAKVKGLESVPPGERPPVNPVHLAFQLMVAIGFGMLALAAWFAWVWRKRRQLPSSKWFLRAALVAGPAAVAALEAGWVVTEVGRQPWIVYGIMRVREAVTGASGIRYSYFVLVVVYAALTAGAVVVLRRLGRSPVPEALLEEPGAPHEDPGMRTRA